MSDVKKVKLFCGVDTRNAKPEFKKIKIHFTQIPPDYVDMEEAERLSSEQASTLADLLEKNLPGVVWDKFLRLVGVCDNSKGAICLGIDLNALKEYSRVVDRGDGPTEIFSLDEPGAGGACHLYSVVKRNSVEPVANIAFQKGPIKEEGVNGCFMEDLLLIVQDRLEGFQSGDFPCVENAMALQKIKEALFWLDARTNDRQDRGVEGTSEK